MADNNKGIFVVIAAVFYVEKKIVVILKFFFFGVSARVIHTVTAHHAILSNTVEVELIHFYN